MDIFIQTLPAHSLDKRPPASRASTFLLTCHILTPIVDDARTDVPYNTIEDHVWFLVSPSTRAHPTAWQSMFALFYSKVHRLLFSFFAVFLAALTVLLTR